MTERQIVPGDRIVLRGQGLTRLVQVPAEGETVKIEGVGVLAQDVFEGKGVGDRLTLGRNSYRLLPLAPRWVFEALNRAAQVITPKDAARIAHGCSIGPGSTVVEGGVGSGGLTTYLAHLVGGTGRVEGFDLRADHIGVARGNVDAAGLAERVTWHEGDLAEADIPCDAFIADVPDPAAVVPAAERCLVPGGSACFYNPVVSQVEAVHEALGAHAFSDVWTIELLERAWVVHERGARPDFDMLGHTGFLTFAARVHRSDAGSAEDRGE